METNITISLDSTPSPVLPRHHSAPPTVSIRGSPPLGDRFVTASIVRRNGQPATLICFTSAIDTSHLILQNLGVTEPNQPRIVSYTDLIRCPVLWGTLVAFRGYQGYIDYDTTRDDALLFLIGAEGCNFDVLASAVDDAGAVDCFIPSLGLSLYDLLDLCLSRPATSAPKVRPDLPQSSSEDSDPEIETAAKTLSLLFSDAREARGKERSGGGRKVKERSRSPPPTASHAPTPAKPQKKRTSDDCSEGVDMTGLPEGIYRGYSKSWANCCASCHSRSSPVWRKGWAVIEPDTVREGSAVAEEENFSLELSPVPSRSDLLANLCNACGLQYASGNILPGDPRASKGAMVTVVSRRRTH
jgi:hypothetical protein